MRSGAERRNRSPARRRYFVWKRGIMRAITSAVMIPKMTSGRKYNVHNNGEIPRTFWKLPSVEDSERDEQKCHVQSNNLKVKPCEKQQKHYNPELRIFPYLQWHHGSISTFVLDPDKQGEQDERQDEKEDDIPRRPPIRSLR
jgi:hypothetical protein